MKKCIVLGKEAMLSGNFPVGSILIQNNIIVGIGKETVKPNNDIARYILINHQSIGIRFYTIYGSCICVLILLESIK